MPGSDHEDRQIGSRRKPSRTSNKPTVRLYLQAPPEAERGCDAQERATEQVLGGKRTRGSGSSTRAAHKGDVLGAYRRAECKTTEKGTLPIARVWLDKIRAEALATGDAPMFVFGFDSSPREDWAAFPLAHAKNMSRAVAALLDGDIDSARDFARLTAGRNATS